MHRTQVTVADEEADVVPVSQYIVVGSKFQFDPLTLVKIQLDLKHLRSAGSYPSTGTFRRISKLSARCMRNLRNMLAMNRSI